MFRWLLVLGPPVLFVSIYRYYDEKDIKVKLSIRKRLYAVTIMSLISMIFGQATKYLPFGRALFVAAVITAIIATITHRVLDKYIFCHTPSTQ